MNSGSPPTSSFNLYPLVDAITGRFSVVAAALQLVAVASIVACALSGLVRLKWLSSLRSCAIIVVVMFATVTGLKGVLSHAISHEYGGAYRALVERTPLLENVKERHSEPEPLSPSQQASDRLDLIQNRGWLRVGYVEDRLPFAFRNDSGAVVGLDPELARGLAVDLEVGVEFVRLSVDDAGAAVMNGSVDILMSGLVMEPSRTRFIRYSIPYMNITAALAVPDQARQEFSSLPRLTERDELRIGSFPAVRYLNGLKRYLPNVDIVPFTSPRPFFTGELDVDAVLLSAEEAAAWTLIYPRYSVAVPFGDGWGAPVAWAMDISAVSLHRFVDAWIEMAKRDGTVDRAFSYWIMGQDPPGRRVPRWSVVRNVFGWVK